MPILQGKKTEVVGSKVSQQEFDVLQSICDREDRSMSYVLRELAIRGLAQYLKDGRLKTTADEDKRIAAARSTTNGHPRIIHVPVMGETSPETRRSRKAG